MPAFPEDWQQSVDAAWLHEAERRSAELDEDPSKELSHEEFLAGIKIRHGHG